MRSHCDSLAAILLSHSIVFIAKELHRILPDFGRFDLMFSLQRSAIAEDRARQQILGGHQSAMTKWPGLLLALMLPGPALTAANAQASYPTRPIRLILPFPAGGAVDHVARLVTARIGEDL
jgi:hypothetical protein